MSINVSSKGNIFIKNFVFTTRIFCVRMIGRDEARAVSEIVLMNKEVSAETVTALVNNEELVNCVKCCLSSSSTEDLEMRILYLLVTKTIANER